MTRAARALAVRAFYVRLDAQRSSEVKPPQTGQKGARRWKPLKERGRVMWCAAPRCDAALAA
jgi:hypothetical protein